MPHGKVMDLQVVWWVWLILHCELIAYLKAFSVSKLLIRKRTSAYSGTVPEDDTIQIAYSPIFTTLYNSGLTTSSFSIAIDRNISGAAGWLTFGGLPPVDFVDNFTSTPILITTISGYPVKYDFYTIEIDAITLAGKDYVEGVADDTQYIVR